MDYTSQCRTIKLWEENKVEILHDQELGKDFIDITVRPQFIEEKH